MVGNSRNRARNDLTAQRIRPQVDELERRVVLSTFRVNTVLDTVAVNLKTGKDASGHISLRSAIMAANSKPNADTIIMPKGTYILTIAGAGEDNDETGDLDIHGKLTINGKRTGSTVVDGNNLDRVFQIFSDIVKISGITIQHGAADQGGGLLNSGGDVSLVSVVVQNNRANGSNGAIGTAGSDASSTGNKGGNASKGTDAVGGGVSNAAGSLTITKSLIVANEALGGTGGAGGKAGNALGAPGAAGATGGEAGGGVATVAQRLVVAWPTRRARA